MPWYYDTHVGYTDFYDLDSWVEISSQPSSSSLSSINDDIVTTGLRVQHDPRTRRRRTLRPGAPSHLVISNRATSATSASSQEEYEESESESDKVMTSSGEGLSLPTHMQANVSPAVQSSASEGSVPRVVEENDGNRTAIHYPIHLNEQCFTPQPNAFSHPPSSGQTRHASQPVAGSYFPSPRPGPTSRSGTRQSLPLQHETARQNHFPQNILSPSYNAAAHHDEALRASLSTLLSIGAAARGLQKPDPKRPSTLATPSRSNRVEPLSLRLVPESALPVTSPPQFHEPTFPPTLQRISTSTSASSEQPKENKRKAGGASGGRSASRERRALKKARRSSASSSAEQQLAVTPTLLTWAVSAGVVVFLSALSFSAGFSLGREAGRLEAGSFGRSGGGTGPADEQVWSCAREAGRSSLGFKRSLARSAVAG